MRTRNILYWEKGMDVRSTEVSKGFVYLHFKEKGYGLFVNQLEAFGSLLLKTGSKVEYDAETASIMYECEGKERQIHLAQLSFMQAKTGKKSTCLSGKRYCRQQHFFWYTSINFWEW